MAPLRRVSGLSRKGSRPGLRPFRLNYLRLLGLFGLAVFLLRTTIEQLFQAQSEDVEPPSPPISPPTSTSTPVPLQLDRRGQILAACGDLCNLQRPVRIPDPYFGYFGETTANVDCRALFQTPLLDEPNASVPRHVPLEYRNDYEMQGRATIESWYIQDVYLGPAAKQTVWTEEQIETWKQQALQGNFDGFGNYQLIDRQTLFDVLKNVVNITNQSVLVLGSETPWVEALCLASGAKTVTTLEYGAIVSHHPQVHVLTPSEFRHSYLSGTLSTFDAIVSYSSLEHSGLGRYGDSLNPWGDIMSLARAWCVTKKGGTLTLGLPSGHDKVYFNAARIYGIQRWPYMTTNWARVNYSSGWGPEVIQNAAELPQRLRGPKGHKIFWNQSSLVFRKTGPAGSVDELPMTKP